MILADMQSVIDDPIAVRSDNFLLAKFESIDERSGAGSGIIWRYPQYDTEQTLPEQGFKIHLSATIFNSGEIYDTVVPYLLAKNIHFKVIGSNDLLAKMNSNRYGYRQVGKFITVYPFDEDHAVELSKNLYSLTQEFCSPRIPSDIRLSPTSIVHYRYGQIIQKLNSLSLSPAYINRPDGTLEKDSRDPNFPIPIWVKDPLKDIWPQSSCHKLLSNKLFAQRFILLKTLRQRAKGGVYLGLDMGNEFSQDTGLRVINKVVIKEARYLGEIEQSGIDATGRIQWQATIQNKLAFSGISPLIYDFFCLDKNYYLVMEACGPCSLTEILYQGEMIDSDRKHDWICSLLNCMVTLHNENIFFFDLSPDNIRIMEGDTIKLVDFEYALAPKAPPFIGWDVGTRGFFPSLALLSKSNIPEAQWAKIRDIYGLGAIILAILCPEWYKKLLSGEYKLEQDSGQSTHYGQLSIKIKNILARAALQEGKDHYQTIEELRCDIMNEFTGGER